MLSDKIKKLRIDKKMTQQELANKLDLSQSTIGMVESGRREVSFDILIKIANFFEVSTDYLLDLNSEQLKEDITLFETDKKIPSEFINPNEARVFVESFTIFGSDGFESDKLDDKEIIVFANALLEQMDMMKYKYKK